MKKIFIFLFYIGTQYIYAQEGNNWVFGLNAGIDFNYSPPKPFVSDIHNLVNGTKHCVFLPQKAVHLMRL